MYDPEKIAMSNGVPFAYYNSALGADLVSNFLRILGPILAEKFFEWLTRKVNILGSTRPAHASIGTDLFRGFVAKILRDNREEVLSLLNGQVALLFDMLVAMIEGTSASSQPTAAV